MLVHTQSITRDQLSLYFHLPIVDVAKKLGICATMLKKVCRRNGIPRWPFRKIKSLDKMISGLESALDKSPEDSQAIVRELAALRSKRAQILRNPEVLAKKRSSGGLKDDFDADTDDELAPPVYRPCAGAPPPPSPPSAVAAAAAPFIGSAPFQTAAAPPAAPQGPQGPAPLQAPAPAQPQPQAPQPQAPQAQTPHQMTQLTSPMTMAGAQGFQMNPQIMAMMQAEAQAQAQAQFQAQQMAMAKAQQQYQQAQMAARMPELMGSVPQMDPSLASHGPLLRELYAQYNPALQRPGPAPLRPMVGTASGLTMRELTLPPLDFVPPPPEALLAQMQQARKESLWAAPPQAAAVLADPSKQ
eukprot:m51a1_g8223 hypothetical protein (357) ;mRNA; r:108755-110743